MAPQAEPVPDGTLDSAAAQLYALAPEEFTAARDARAAQAKAAGQRELAAGIRRLRRPALSAWAVNLLARHEAGALADLVELAGELRTAQSGLQRDALRELMRRRQQLLSGLVADAGRLAAQAGHPLADEAGRQVERTLTAALSDPEAAGQVLSGQLVSPLEYAGFGEALDWSTPPPAEPAPTRDGGAARDAGARPATDGTRSAAPGRRQPGDTGGHTGGDTGRGARGGSGAPTRRSPDRDADRPGQRPQADRRVRLEAELAAAEQELAEAAEHSEQAHAAQRRADQDRERAATRREQLHRELAAVQEEHAAAELAGRQAARRAAVLERNRAAAQRRVDRLRTQLSPQE
jgi:hypothetical protein